MAEIVRRCFVVDLVDDPESIARYREWHKPGGPPRAVTDAIRADGVNDLQIWVVGDRMVMIMEQDDTLAADCAAKAARDAANPDVQAWDALMRTFQRPLPFAPDITWVEMQRIYSLAAQPIDIG
ncbi:L-rhamnose mutarotase [Sphingobium lactosutens]|uniref:L-rhamnose mutarotase n=1 Tax=Sphingobium lactosutens TaxID=522773 RepID=UPI0015B88C77|nr:L-rhamnose mutarotase [Sphingobium lactosutens]NWK98368.1 L-rhamnose mutarotase [Sphingobium lactosutens]